MEDYNKRIKVSVNPEEILSKQLLRKPDVHGLNNVIIVRLDQFQ